MLTQPAAASVYIELKLRLRSEAPSKQRSIVLLDAIEALLLLDLIKYRFVFVSACLSTQVAVAHTKADRKTGSILSAPVYSISRSIFLIGLYMFMYI